MMSDLLDTLGKNWKAAAAVFGFASSALLTFRSLIDMPLHVRLILIGVFGVIMVVFAVVTLAKPPARDSIGFLNQPVRERSSRLVTVAKLVVIVLVCGIAVLLLQLTITYHNIVLSQTADRDDTAAGRIESQSGALFYRCDTHSVYTST